MVNAKKKKKFGWAKEIDDLVRGICGGLLFGMPLLYTMEVWWIGSSVTPAMMLGAIALTAITVFLLNQTEGFRKTQRSTKRYDTLHDTVEAIAIGLICSALVLLLLREVNTQISLRESIGKVVYESVPFTLGVAVANQLLGDSRDTQPSPPQSSSKSLGSASQHSTELNATLADIGATLIGAVFVAFNIAPTDEVAMLSAAVTPPWMIAIVVASLITSYGIVFEAGFSNQQKRMQQQGIFQRPLSETIASYLVSLAASAFMLWFFQRLSFSDPWSMWLEYSILLGFPAATGGAAGRLAV